MAAPAGNTKGHRAEVTASHTDFRERMFAVAIAAKLTEIPRSCPKCHAPDHCFVRYPHSLECLCGWTGYFPTVIESDGEPLEAPRTLEQKRREAGYSRVRNMSQSKLKQHTGMMRAAKVRP